MSASPPTVLSLRSFSTSLSLLQFLWRCVISVGSHCATNQYSKERRKKKNTNPTTPPHNKNAFQGHQNSRSYQTSDQPSIQTPPHVHIMPDKNHREHFHLPTSGPYHTIPEKSSSNIPQLCGCEQSIYPVSKEQ